MPIQKYVVAVPDGQHDKSQILQLNLFCRKIEKFVLRSFLADIEKQLYES